MILRAAITLLASLTILLLSACGEKSETQPSPSPLQRVSFVDSSLSPGFAVRFPSAWTYHVRDTGLMISSDPNLLNSPDENGKMPSGALAMNISLLTESDLRKIGARGPADLIDALTPQYRPAKAINLDDRAGAQAFLSTPDSDSLLLALKLESSYLLMLVVTPKDELQSHADALNAIAASAELLMPS